MVIGRTELHSPEEVRKRFEAKTGYITIHNPKEQPGMKPMVYFVSCDTVDEHCKQLLDGNTNKKFDPYKLELCYFDSFKHVDLNYKNAMFMSMRIFKEEYSQFL